MNYYANDIQGVRHGPLTEEQLIALADEGLIQADSAVKKEIMRGWFPASDLKFLAPHLSAGPKEGENGGKTGAVSSAPEAAIKSSFENMLIPVHAGLLLRIQAACHDLLILLIATLLIMGAGTLAAFVLSDTVKDGPEVQAVLEKREPSDKKDESVKEKKKPRTKRREKKAEAAKTEAAKTEDGEKPDRSSVEMKGRPSIVSDEADGYRTGSIWKDTKTGETFVCLSATERNAVWCSQSRIRIIALVVWTVCLLAWAYLFLVPLALTAQTPGMHYYGIFVSDAKDPTREVLELRAVSEYLLSLFLWIATPVLLILGKPTVAENVTGTRIIRISAKR